MSNENENKNELSELEKEALSRVNAQFQIIGDNITKEIKEGTAKDKDPVSLIFNAFANAAFTTMPKAEAEKLVNKVIDNCEAIKKEDNK